MHACTVMKQGLSLGDCTTHLHLGPLPHLSPRCPPYTRARRPFIFSSYLTRCVRSTTCTKYRPPSPFHDTQSE